MHLIKRGLICLLAICLLSAFSAPCMDEPSHDEEQAELSVGTGEGHESDECSPFCVCNCCPAVRSHLSQPFALAIYLPVNELRAGHLGSDISSHHSSIWQPPRAGLT